MASTLGPVQSVIDPDGVVWWLDESTDRAAVWVPGVSMVTLVTGAKWCSDPACGARHLKGTPTATTTDFQSAFDWIAGADVPVKVLSTGN